MRTTQILQQHIKDLLDRAVMQNRPLDIIPKSSDMRDVVEEVLEIIQFQAESSRVKLNFTHALVQPEHPVEVDKPRLQ